MPYPCNGPSALRVLRTIRLSVPGRTSFLCCFIRTPVDKQHKSKSSPVDSQHIQKKWLFGRKAQPDGFKRSRRIFAGNRSDVSRRESILRGWRQKALARNRTTDLHRPDPCTIFEAKAGFTSALLWSDSLIGKTTNDIPAGGGYASNLQMPALYSLFRGHRSRNGFDDPRRLGAKSERRAGDAPTADRLQTPDRADLGAKLLPVPRREEGDGTIASRR